MISDMQVMISSTNLKYHSKLFSLQEVPIYHFMLAENLKLESYYYFQGKLELAFKAGEKITQEKLRLIGLSFSPTLLVHYADAELLKEKLQNSMMSITRSLSMGEALPKVKNLTHYLTLNLEALYKNPFDNIALTNQHKSISNLGIFLINNQQIQKDVFQSYRKKPYQYTLAQPMLSSLLMLSFIQSLGVYGEKEIENLFITSYFKDIGMSLIPSEKLNAKSIDTKDLDAINDHVETSTKIISSRLNLPKSYLNILENHHAFNKKIQAILSGQNYDYKSEVKISGIESALLAMTDIFMALITDRPYRSKASIFKALELLKEVIADDYPKEFRQFVLFIKNFL